MLLFQSIENIDIEVSQLLTLIETKKAYQATLIELDAKADDLLEQLGELVAKVKYHAPNEIGSLRNAVLNLFDGDDNNNHPNNQPPAPTPETTQEPETTALNQPCPDSTTPTQSTKDESPYIELIQHPQNKAIAYQRKHDSEIVCVYLGGNSMSRIKSWSEWLYRQNWGLTRTECNNSRKALRLSEFKYELKLPAMSRERINQLALHNFSKLPKMPAEVPKTTGADTHKAPPNPSSPSPQTLVTTCKFERTVGDQLGIGLAG
jgi:hypothetical protein